MQEGSFFSTTFPILVITCLVGNSHSKRWCISDLAFQNQSISSLVSPPPRKILWLALKFILYPFLLLYFLTTLCFMSTFACLNEYLLWIFAMNPSSAVSYLDCIRITKGAFAKCAGLTCPHFLLQGVSEWSVEYIYFAKSFQMFFDSYNYPKFLKKKQLWI